MVSKLKIVRENEHTIWAFCPFHHDTKTPNLMINKDGEWQGHYVCWACGARGLAADLGVEIEPGKVSKQYRFTDWITLHGKFKAAFKHFTNPLDLSIKNLAVRENFGKFNVGYLILQKFGIGYDEEKRAFTFPMYNAHGEITGIQYRRADDIHEKWSAKGSCLGIFKIENADYYKVEPLIITEGVTDAMTAAAALGKPWVIGRASAQSCERIIKKFVQLNAIENVLIIADNDEAGNEGAWKLQEVLAPAVNTTVATTLGKENYKDITDYAKAEGLDKVGKELRKRIIGYFYE